MTQWLTEAETAEAEKVRRIVQDALDHAVAEGRFPDFLSGQFDVEFDEDWQGEPAVRIWLHKIRSELPSDDQWGRLRRLLSGVDHTLLHSGLGRWPYVDIKPNRR